jgi:cytoskeleton protein RodZ
MNNQENTNTIELGKALQDARLAASLTVDEVAEKLNLAISAIRDIEDNLDLVINNQKYPPVYLRGYIANYAKLVGLDKFEQFPEYQQLSAPQDIAKNIRPPVKASSAGKRGKWLLFLIILLAVTGLGFFAVQQLFFTSSSEFSDRKEIKQEQVNIAADAEQEITAKKKTVADKTGK